MVQLLNICRDTESGHGVKYTQRMAPLKQLVGVPSVESSSNDEDDIVDHVRIPASNS